MPDRPIFPASLVLEVLRASEEAGVEVYVSGGWGIDAIVGHQTRDHHDLDLAVEESQVPAAIGALAGAGFVSVPEETAREDEERTAAAMATLTDLGFVVDGEDGPALIDASTIDVPAFSKDQLLGLMDVMSGLGFGRGGAAAARARDGAGHVVVLHRMQFDEGRWQDPEADEEPTWVPVAAADSRGSIDGQAVQCVPGTIHAVRTNLEFSGSDADLRDRLLLRDHAGIPFSLGLGIRPVSGVIPASDVAAAYLRWYDRAFPARDSETDPLEMVEVPDDPDEWASTLVDSVIGPTSQPTEDEREYSWQLLLALVTAANQKQLNYIAAGPVEDFLSQHGEAVIERVEAQAAADPKFRHMLGGVWQLSMSHEVYARVRKAAGDERW